MKAARIFGPIAAMFLVSSTAFAQTGNTMTVSGCLMGEKAYRDAHHLKKGEFFGVGLGNEYVLVEGNCGDNSNGKAYRLTGKTEKDLKPFVGKRIEVTGQWDHERDAKTAAGQTNAKLPPEIRIASFHEATVTASAPATGSANATAATPAPESTVASNEPRKARALPKTASNEPLFALIGLVSLTLAFGVGLLRLRLT